MFRFFSLLLLRVLCRWGQQPQQVCFVGVEFEFVSQKRMHVVVLVVVVFFTLKDHPF